MQNIGRVCILGGTHGNELSGVYLLKHFQKNPDVIMRTTFETKTCISNPKAVEVNRRYIDVDLNRSFTSENLAAKLTVDTQYEVKRVQELKAMLGDGGEIGRCDLLLDLHNTTANTRVCLIHRELDPFTMQLMHYVSNQLPAEMCYCTYYEAAMKYSDSRTLAPCGIGIEVGPQPQGVLRADIFNLQRETLKHCLDFVESFNTGTVFAETDFHTYQLVERVPFPRDEEGAISVMIHSSLQDKDWSTIAFGDPVFQYLNGRVLYLKDVVNVAQYDGKTLYPMFINEAAYYEKDIAFCLTKKRTVRIPELRKQ